jgi:hypothetical protein
LTDADNLKPFHDYDFDNRADDAVQAVIDHGAEYASWLNQVE